MDSGVFCRSTFCVVCVAIIVFRRMNRQRHSQQDSVVFVCVVDEGFYERLSLGACGLFCESCCSAEIRLWWHPHLVRNDSSQLDSSIVLIRFSTPPFL